MRLFVDSHILSVFWAWHCSKIQKSNRTILCSQHTQKSESTNNLMSYYGLNIKLIVHSHMYQPVRGHWFFLMHLKLNCFVYIYALLHTGWQIRWHDIRVGNIRDDWSDLIFFLLFLSRPNGHHLPKTSGRDLWQSRPWIEKHTAPKKERTGLQMFCSNLSSNNLSKRFVNLFSPFLE